MHSHLAVDDVDIVEAYERLRNAALGKAAARASGWSIFLRRGMWAWIEASCSLPSASIRVDAPTPGGASSTDAKVVRVLAAMVLAVEAVRNER